MTNNQESSLPEIPNPDLSSQGMGSRAELPPGSRAGIGLAVASFVLGLVSLVLSLFVIGAVFGVAGLVLGIVHLSKRMPFFKTMAVWGIALSVIGSLAGIGLGVFYGIYIYRVTSEMKEWQAESYEEYIGAPTPDIKLTDIEGNDIVLSQLKGKRVVLDFWATWCPPCKKEIPHFIRLVNEKESDNLAIIGISSEDTNVLKDFVKENGINYPIVSADNLPFPYDQISSVPTTFFIDRNGIIQSVLVGYQDYKTLKENVLAENYQGEQKTALKPPQTNLMDSEIKYTPKLQWTLDIPESVSICTGNWSNDGKEKILVADRNKNLHIIGVEGQIQSSITIPEVFRQIEIGKYKQNSYRLLGYSNWGKKVTVVDTNGMKLWEYPSLSGVNGAHWGDLDGDNNDEMIIGMNGSGGLHAISCDGKKRWKVSSIGNVWNQAVVAGRDPEHTLVFATEAGGTIQVYDGNGQRVRILRPFGKYHSKMAASLIDNNGNIQVTAIGSDGTVVAFDPMGQIAWTTSGLKQSSWRASNFACGDIDRDGRKDWGFLEANGDLVIVTPDGIKLASLPGQKSIEGFSICSGLSGGALVTMNKGKISLYSFKEN